MPPDLRDTVVDFVRNFSGRTELATRWVLGHLGVAPAQFYRGRARYGHVNRPTGWTPRDHWLTSEERQAILDYHDRHPLDGYRRLTFMMLEADVVAVSPATSIGCSAPRGSSIAGTPSCPARVRAFCNRSGPTSIGTSTSAT